VPNFYEILGIASSADSEQVKASFHRLAKTSHPDVNSGDATAERRFKEVNQAYEVLGDPERRAVYDLGLKHKHAETRRRVRNAMVATAASFMITVGCGLYLSLSHISRSADRHEPTAHAESYSRLAPLSEQDSPRQRVEGWAQVGQGPARSPPEPQSHETVLPRTELPDREGHAAATHAAERQGTLIALGMEGPTSSTSDPQSQREYALHLHAKGMEQIQQGNVAAARMFFVKAARAGSVASMRALAGTYDPVQLTKLKVIGTQPDVDAARQWYDKAGGDAVATAERAVRKNGELNVATDKAAWDLQQFRTAYISGDGLTYVVMHSETGEHIYRYGDVSRLVAKKDKRTYTLFTCDTAHVFTPESPEDLAALRTATLVTPVDPLFAELDAKYLSACPHAKSAIPRS
jgi:DnaJ domain